MDEMKPCPFCGGTEIFIEPDEAGSGGQWVAPIHVGCKKCQCEQMADDMADAITAWNTRHREDAGVVDDEMVDAALFCTPVNEYGEDMEMPIDAMGLGSIQQLPRARLIMKAALAAALGKSNG